MKKFILAILAAINITSAVELEKTKIPTNLELAEQIKELHLSLNNSERKISAALHDHDLELRKLSA